MGRIAPRALILLLIAVLSIGLLAACGDDDDGGGETTTEATTTTPTAPPADTTGEGPAGPTVLEIPADETMLAFQVTEATAPAGEVTLRMENPSGLDHNIAVDMPTPTEGEVVGQGGVSEITVNFPAGEYEYYCSVAGHRAAGMTGTLTVE